MRCARSWWLWDFTIPLLAHPPQRPGASIPLQVLPLVPLAAGNCFCLTSLWLSRLTWERDQSMQSSGCSQALSVSCWHRGCRSDIPCKTLWKHHCQELFLGLHISLCVQSL